MKKRPFEQLVPKQRRDVNATWQIGEGRPKPHSKPPALGDVAIERTSETEWRVQRNGETLASGVAFADVLAVIRGELDVDALETPCSNGNPLQEAENMQEAEKEKSHALH